MKKLFTLAIVALITTTTAYSQAVPNGGFESATGTKADNWTQVRGKVEAISELAITANGVPGVANPHGKNGLAITNTDSVGSAISDKFAINTRPAALRFLTCYFPRQSNEGFGATILCTKWNTGTNSRDTLYNRFVGSVAGVIYPWADVTFPLYDTSWKSNETPDTAQLTFSAGATTRAAQNTLFWIDNVKFSEYALSNNEVKVNTLSEVSMYPNPAVANSETKLSYTLHTNSKVEITLMDIQGKVVQEVLNEEQTYGVKEVNVRLSDLSSGIYFYSIKTEQATKTVKFVVE